LVKADYQSAPEGPHAIHVTTKYWAMAQFSRFIRPGYRLAPVDDLDTVGALSPDGRELVLVHVNGGLSPRQLTPPSGWTGRMIVTDARRRAEPLPGLTAPPRSIATLVLRRTG
jgi:hypothetical protein